MALQKMQTVAYKDIVSEDEKIEFVHEILRTSEEKEFKWPHRQQYYEIIFFNGGFRDVKIGDCVVHHCSAGDILLFTPDEKHTGRSYDCLLDRYVLHFGKRAFSVFGSQGAELLRMFTDRPLYTDNHLRLPTETAAQVNALLADADKALRMKNGTPLAAMEALSDIMKILILLSYSVQEGKRRGAPSQMMLQIQAYIESNYNRIDSAEEICREFAVSRSGLWRMFRQYMNQTPGEYIRRIRLENARYILEQGGSVTDACMECGFTDCSHFIRLFRDAYGVTPYRYKKEHSFVGESGGEV